MNDAIVIDNGSGISKAGFSSSSHPDSVFSSVIGRSKFQNLRNLDEFVGNEAQLKKEMLTIRYPIEHGVIKNWEDMEKIWKYTFMNELKVSPDQHPILLTEPSLNPRKNREKMSEIMFETFEVPALYVAIQAVLSLYSTGLNTGIVLDCGDGVTHLVPTFEGFHLPHASIRIDMAGREVTHYLRKLLLENGHVFSTTAENEIVRDIKEKLCYVAIDFEDELESFCNPQQRKSYRLPNGEVISIESEMIKSPEVFFKPSLIDMEYEGVHKLIYNSINKSPIDFRKELCKNVIITGGSTLFPNFQDRLQNELIKLLPNKMNPNVITPANREFSVWIGGSVLTSMSSFNDMWVTKEEYHEMGPAILHKKCT